MKKVSLFMRSFLPVHERCPRFDSKNYICAGMTLLFLANTVLYCVCVGGGGAGAPVVSDVCMDPTRVMSCTGIIIIDNSGRKMKQCLVKGS